MSETGCPFCDGHIDAFELTLTGRWTDVDHLTYAGTRYFVHGAVYEKAATHLWLVPASSGPGGVA